VNPLGIIVLVTASMARPARASAPHRWELDAGLGYGQILYPAIDTAAVTSTMGGPGFAATVAYRGPHFTHPFVDLAYVPILSSRKQVDVSAPDGSIRTVAADSSSYALGLVIGPGWDVDWFRLRVGVGVYDVVVSTTVDGATNSASTLELGFLASTTALVWRPDPFALGFEARLVALQTPTMGITQTMGELGVTARWDFVRRPGAESQ
jgi:hypothetical protein